MTGASAAATVRPDVSLHAIGDEAVLFDPATRRLFNLSADEATAWCLLCEHGEPRAAAAALSDAVGCPPAVARSWLDAALSLWSEAGLLGAPRQVMPSRFPVVRSPAGRGRYRILDTTIDVVFDDAADSAAAASLLAGFATAAPAELTAALIHDDDGCAVVVDGHVAERAPRRIQAIPLLKLALVQLGLSRASGLAAVHGAALALGGRAVLLPAPAGSGKSTLAAACAFAPEWELLGDDTVVLDQAGALRPLPFAICLKQGAWSLPALAGRTVALETYERPDDLRVRYLPAPRPGLAARPLAALVLPQWRAGAVADIVPISSGAGFRGLIMQLFPLAGPFDATLVAQVARLMEATPCYALTYDALEDGVARLTQMMQS